MKTQLSIQKSTLIFVCSALMFINTSVILINIPEEKPSNWHLLKNNDYIEINYRYGQCNLPNDGSLMENVYLQLKNKTDEIVVIKWETEYWYNNQCYGCEEGKTRYRHSIVLNPNEIIEGECSEQISQSLIIFSKIINNKIQPELTGFNLKNIRTALIINANVETIKNS